RGTSPNSPAPGFPAISISTTTCIGWCSHSVLSAGTWRSAMPDRDSDGLLVVAPLRIEARALRASLERDSVVHIGPRARHEDRLHAAVRDSTAPVVVAGVAGGLGADMRAGDLVVADQLRSARATTTLPAATLLVAALRQAGHTVHTGTVVESDRVVDGAARDELAATEAVAVDMESARVVESLPQQLCGVVRVVSDTPGEGVRSPAVLRNGRAALAVLSGLGTHLRQWASVLADRKS